MSKALFLLCPTDCLETVVNKIFKYENYFYTSLGNSFVADTETITHIKELLTEYSIENIYFVLSNDNQIILDALRGQFFSRVRGLKRLYREIIRQKRNCEVMWSTNSHQDSIISYFLNHKIKELQFELRNIPNHSSLKISGKIYNKFEDAFTNIYSSLTYLEQYCLN